MSETKIETDTSKLIVHQLPTNIMDKIKMAVEESKDKLNKTPKIFVFGKECKQHRNVGFFSNTSIGYKYSGRLSSSKELTQNLKTILEYINNYFSSDYNGILINEYIDGTDYISAHSDDETSLSDNGVVMISYGAKRKFRIRNKLNKQIIIDIPTKNNELIQMTGDFQKEFLHEVPIEKKVKETRYSLTFRKHTV
jgi:alkylated DNA repair dioxygenase AlkB